MEKLSTSQRSPLSPKLWPTDAFSALRSATFVGGIAVALGLGVVLSILILHFAHLPLPQNAKNIRLTAALLTAQIIVYIPVVLTALPLLPMTAQRTLREIGLRAPGLPDVRAALIGCVLMYAATELAAYVQKFVLHVQASQQAVQLFGTTTDRHLIAGLVLLAVVIAPFVEELIFRGFVFNAILRYLPVGVAAALSGSVFGLAHYDGSFSTFLPLACGGFVLAMVYYRTGSLAASMLTHATFNALNVALVLATGGKI